MEHHLTNWEEVWVGTQLPNKRERPPVSFVNRRAYESSEAEIKIKVVSLVALFVFLWIINEHLRTYFAHKLISITEFDRREIL